MEDEVLGEEVHPPVGGPGLLVDAREHCPCMPPWTVHADEVVRIGEKKKKSSARRGHDGTRREEACPRGCVPRRSGWWAGMAQRARSLATRAAETRPACSSDDDDEGKEENEGATEAREGAASVLEAR